MKARDRQRSNNSVERFQRALKTRWLNGVEYLTLLTQHERLARILKIPLFLDSKHPDSIYFAPEQTPVYFLLLDSIDNVQFACREQKMDFVWKKQHPVTSIPKQNPLVKYVTATCTSVSTTEEYRMHIIWKAQSFDAPNKQILVCHVMRQSTALCKLKMTADLNWRRLPPQSSRPLQQSVAEQSSFKLTVQQKQKVAATELFEGVDRPAKTVTSIRKKFIFQPTADSLNVGTVQTPADCRELGKRDMEQEMQNVEKIVLTNHCDSMQAHVTDIFGSVVSRHSTLPKISPRTVLPISYEADFAPKNLFRCTLPEPTVFDKSDYFAWIRDKLDSLNSS